MPKSRGVRTIDRPYTITGGTNGGVPSRSSVSAIGATDHGALTGLLLDDHPQYLTPLRADVRYYRQSAIDAWRVTHAAYNDARYYTQALIDAWRTSHLADADAHHNQSHDLLSSDHTLAGGTAGYLLTATGTTTFGFAPLQAGTAIDITWGGSDNTVAVDVDALAGLGLINNGGALEVNDGSTLTLSGDLVEVDESAAFAWTNDHTHTGHIGSTSFASGFGGNGWRIDSDDDSATFDDLTVRGTFSVYELLVRQIRATNGAVHISAAAQIESVTGSGPYYLIVKGEDDTDVQPFVVNDLIRSQRWDGQNVHVCDLHVTGINVSSNSMQFSANLIAGSVPAAGMEFVRIGNSIDTDRQGSVYLTADDDDAPYIQVIDGVNSHSDWGTADVLKMRLGNLSGITDTDYGVLTGYGLYADNAYLRGGLSAGSGNVIIDANAINLAAMNSSGRGAYTEEITWTDTPTDPSSGKDVAYMYSYRWDNSGTVENVFSLATGSVSTDRSIIDIRANVSGGTDTAVTMTVEAGASTLLLNSDLITLNTDVDVSGDVIPTTDSSRNLGSNSYKWAELHVDTLYAGTTSSVDTGHNHNDLYYTESEIDATLAGYSVTSHSHAGTATVVYVDATFAPLVHTHATTDVTSGTWADARVAQSNVTQHQAALSLTESQITDFGSYSTTGHAHATTDVTSGTFADARVAESNVTQHQAALSITESQISDLGSYSATGHTHTATDVTAGSFADGRITESSVTQHSAALFASPTLTGTTTASAINGTIITASTRLDSTELRSTGGTISIADNTGIYAQITRTGIESVVPLFSDGLDRQGVQINWDGSADFGDINAVNLSTFTFERNQVSAVGTTLAVSPSGKLYADLTTPAIGGTVDIDVADPQSGGEQVFAVDDVLRISGMAYTSATDSAEAGGLFGIMTTPFSPHGVIDGQQRLSTVYLEVDSAADGDGYTRYTCTMKDGPEMIRYLAGTGIVRWSGGMIVLTSDASSGPYIDMFDASTTPWVSGAGSKYVRLGRLDGLGAITGEQYGIALGSDLDDSTAARIVASDTQFELFKVPIRMNDGSADTVTVGADGTVKFGTDVSADATTIFDFDPSASGFDTNLTIRGIIETENLRIPNGGSTTVYSSSDLTANEHDAFSSWNHDWWARLSRQGLTMRGSPHDSYVTSSPGSHYFVNPGLQVMLNTTQTYDLYSDYPVFRLSAYHAGGTTGYVEHSEEEDLYSDNGYGKYQSLNVFERDPIVKFLGMFAPDATGEFQHFSGSAIMEFGFLDLKRSEETTALRIVGESNGRPWMYVSVDTIRFEEDTTVEINGAAYLNQGIQVKAGNVRIDDGYLIVDLPTDSSDLPKNALYNDAGSVKIKT